jgi:DNA-binding Lrp family transcriptional regulator
MMNPKDTKIIEELRKNSRLSIREIARKTILKPSTVHQRIQKLVSEKVIERFTLKLNNRAAEENFIVFILVKADRELDNRLFSDPHIKEVFGITGEYDLLLKLKFRDIEEFNSYLIEFRKANKLAKTLTMVATLNLKEEI